MNPLRRLYLWVLSLADHPAGPVFLFLIAFMESSFFPIPPDVLLIPLVLGALTKAWRLAALCTLGSVLGGAFGWWIGHAMWYSAAHEYSSLALWFFDQPWLPSQEKFEGVQHLYDEYGPAIVFTAGFTPVPYKLFTIASGAFDMNLAAFLGASAVGRAGRFFLVAGLLRWKGEAIKLFIDRWFNWLSLAMAVAIIAGFYVIKIMPTGH